MKKFLLSLPIFMALAVATLALISSQLASADFNASDIIDDYTFNNTGTMNAGQIDTFLNTFPSSCISWNNHFQAPDPTGYSPSGGFTYGGNVTAGQVIYDAANAYGLNPQVVLTTLQKEQSLVTGGSGCGVKQYVGAMGYGCPDGGTSYSYSGVNLYTINGSTVTSVSGTCVNTSAKAGFSEQVIHAAWLLRFAEQRSEGNIGWDVQLTNAPESGDVWNNSDDPQSCYSGPMTEGTWQTCPGGSSVFYDGYDTIDGSSTYISNGATAALYDYTPHFSGNENFDTIFESWFGPTTGQGFQLVISDGCNSGCPQYVVYGDIKQYVPDSQTINAWGLENVQLGVMPAAQLNAIPTGPNLDRLFRTPGDPWLYMVDGGKKYIVASQAYLDIWNLNGHTISYVPAGLADTPSYGGWLSAFVQPSGSTTIYMLDGASGSNTLLRPYSSQTVFQAIEGENTQPLAITTDLYNYLEPTIGSALTDARFTSGGTDYMVFNGVRHTLTGPTESLYPSSAMAVSAATIERLPDGGNMTYMLQSTSTGTYYVVDGGTTHALGTVDLANAWQAPSLPIMQVGPSFLSTITSGTAINTYTADVSGQMYVLYVTKKTVGATLDTAYRTAFPPVEISSTLASFFPTDSQPMTRFFQEAGTGNVYLLDDSGHKDLFTSQDPRDVLSLWGAYNVGVPLLPTAMTATVSTGINGLGLYVSDGTNDYVISNGKKLPVTAAQQTYWNLGSPQVISDTTLSTFTTGTNLTNTFVMSGAYYIVKNGVVYGTTDPSIGAAWNISNNSIDSDFRLTSLLSGHYGMLTRFVRSSASSNYTMYLVDQGTWYALPWPQYLNFGGPSLPNMILVPDNYTTTSTWLSPVVKDASNSQYYVIDNGGIRNFATQAIANAWTNSGSLSVNTVSDNLINNLHYWGSINQKSIQGSPPPVYTVINGQKCVIISNATFNQSYGPDMLVSDNLIQALPNGTSIP